MKVAGIFSVGCGHGGYGDHRGYGGYGGYGGSERHYGHRDYSRSYYGGHRGEHYDRYNGGGLLGILGKY